MRKTLRLLAVVIATATVLWWSQRITVDEMTHLIQQELPPGTPATRVSAFLDSLRISHGAVRAVPAAGTGFPHGPARLMHASIKDLRRGNLLTDGVFMVFRFDEQDRLLDYVVEYLFTAL